MTYNEALDILAGFVDLAVGMGFFGEAEVKLLDAAFDVLWSRKDNDEA